MTIFWLISALMVLAAIGFVVWPLFRSERDSSDQWLAAEDSRGSMVLDLFNQQRHSLQAQLDSGELDSEQYQQLLKELELSLLEDSKDQVIQASAAHQSRWAIYCAALLLPVATLIFYWQHGSIDDVNILELRQNYFQQQVDAAQQGVEIAPALLDELIVSLNRSLEKRPDNVANRYLLARTYMQQGAFVQAVRHYSILLQQEDTPANIVGELAQALFLASGSSITPEVGMLVERALSLDGNEVTSLGLAGISAFETQHFQAAIDYWGRALLQMEPSSMAARSLQAGISKAQQLLSSDGDVGADPYGSDDQLAELATIDVQVAISSAVSADPESTVFIYARAWQGAKMPLAITRVKMKDLPTLIRLDETMAMAPGMSIRSFAQLELVARISPSGQPTAQSGDWQASAGPIALGELNGPVDLLIDQQLP